MLFWGRRLSPKLALSRNTRERIMNPIEIQVAQDFTCPRCWIGQRDVKTASAADELV
jgi:hypothetical protein